jgi:hypothetical protein
MSIEKFFPSMYWSGLRRGRTAIGDMQQSRQIAVHNE